VLLKIGAAPRRTDEPSAVELLLACHERIRGQVDLARALVEARRAPGAVVADAARDLVRYHTVALPLHQEDEERSVRPRLEAACGEDVRGALARMGEQHAAIDALLAVLLPLWSAVEREPSRVVVVAGELAAPTVALAALWDTHLGGEEDVIFPAIDALLSRAERDAIAAEIRDRRRAALAASS
jgi:hemerythrin-like domain-containing protein